MTLSGATTPEQSLGRSNRTAEVQSVYSTAAVDEARTEWMDASPRQQTP